MNATKLRNFLKDVLASFNADSRLPALIEDAVREGAENEREAWSLAQIISTQLVDA